MLNKGLSHCIFLFSDIFLNPVKLQEKNFPNPLVKDSGTL